MRTATRTKELSRRSVDQCGIATDEALRRIASIRALTGIAQAATPDTARE